MKSVEEYSYSELLKGLDRIRQKFPAVYKWFFLWELEKANDPRQSDPGLGQKQEANSRQA